MMFMITLLSQFILQQHLENPVYWTYDLDVQKLYWTFDIYHKIELLDI